MTDPKDGKAAPGMYAELNEAVAKARMSGEVSVTKGIGARVLQKRHVSSSSNDKGDDTTPPTGRER